MGSLASQTKGVLIAGLILAVVSWGIVRDRAQKVWFDELEQEVLEDTLILTGELEVVKRELGGIVSLYQSSEFVSREEFGVYVQPLLGNHPFIQAFEWVPRISHSEREGFESITRSMGYAEFHVFTSSGPAEAQQEYFPVHYSEPLPDNEGTLGFDLSSDPQLLSLANTARDTGRAVAGSRFGVVPNARSKSDLIILAPLYNDRAERTEERREHLKGFVLGIYRVHDMIDQMVSPYIPKGMNLTVYEEGELVEENLLYGKPLKNPAMKITNVVNVSNRRWFLVWQATDEFRGGAQTLNAFWVGVAIFSAALFLSIIIEIMASRTRVVENEVRVRTEELTLANQKLVELNDLKNKFLGIASHDLRNPLASIRGYSKFLLDKGTQVKEDTRQEFLTTIKNVSGNMLELISNLLDISVIESGQLKLNPALSSMKKLVEEKIHLQQILADKKHITLHADMESVPEFYFDSNRMGQVVDNLLSNAVKYSSPEKGVYVKLVSDDETMTLSVKDEGPGISTDEQGQLFQHFQKLSARPTGGESSSGLGLAIAQRIVEEHQGSIWVDSQFGQGATFYFSLPMENPHQK
ncbi:MAG: CHASE domain-containing protein [Nitrospinae bacterium]|nr:CHASE domain-containing protein [Nitrospinota bacterium]MBL7020124.1 CHASE domain-containing protein [Nitrospinaceae bacterium]